MSNAMHIDAESVYANVNRISVLLEDINVRTQKFIDLVNEKNNATSGKFALIKTLENKVREEASNIDKIGEAQDEIRRALDRYVQLGEEANDDSELA